MTNKHIYEILAQVLGLKLLPAEIEEKSPAYREFGGSNLNHRFKLVSYHLVTLLVADSDDHLDMLLIDRVALQHFLRISIKRLNLNSWNHAPKEILDLHVVVLFLLGHARFYFTVFDYCC